MFLPNATIQEILSKPIDFIESMEYFSWERFFTHILVEQSQAIPTLKYEKSDLATGYFSDKNVVSIVRAMKTKK